MESRAFSKSITTKRAGIFFNSISAICVAICIYKGYPVVFNGQKLHPLSFFSACTLNSKLLLKRIHTPLEFDI